MPETFVQSFTHLKDLPDPQRALSSLQKVASLVKPIMRKHGWVLPVLAEFFPDNPSLLGLNVNMGQKILVRLRPAHSPGAFLEQESIVQTMLHELTHNVHGPHDDQFYKYLAALQEEYEQLQRSGYAGEGFFSPGQRLGTNVSHNLPPHLARARAAEAAEKRRKVSQVLGTAGGRRLGGGGADKFLTLRERAARAAERRMLDEKSCGQGDLAKREADAAAKRSIETPVVDLTDDAALLDQASSRRKTVPATDIGNSLVGKAISKVPHKEREQALGTASGGASKGSSLEWACSVCTLLNKALSLQCEACLTERPPGLSNAGWTCPKCYETGISHDFWSCTFCGAIKTTS